MRVTQPSCQVLSQREAHLHCGLHWRESCSLMTHPPASHPENWSRPLMTRPPASRPENQSCPLMTRPPASHPENQSRPLMTRPPASHPENQSRPLMTRPPASHPENRSPPHGEESHMTSLQPRPQKEGQHRRALPLMKRVGVWWQEWLGWGWGAWQQGGAVGGSLGVTGVH